MCDCADCERERRSAAYRLARYADLGPERSVAEFIAMAGEDRREHQLGVMAEALNGMQEAFDALHRAHTGESIYDDEDDDAGDGSESYGGFDCPRSFNADEGDE